MCLHFAIGQRSEFNGYDVAVGLRFQMSWWRRKQREIESDRDSVKDRKFSLSDIFVAF